MQKNEVRKDIEEILLKEYTSKICSQILFLANTLLNSKPYTM